MFENKMIQTKFGPVHATRIIQSFTRMAWKTVRFPYGSYPMNKIFFEYLDSIEVSKEDQDLVWQIASNGKSELESAASRILSSNYRGQEEKYLPKYETSEEK